MLDSPYGVAVDPQGFLYIADLGNQRIRRVDPSGRISTVAGTGVAGFSGDGGSAILAQLNGPLYVEPLANGAFLVADHLNNRIRHVGASGVITTYLGGRPDDVGGSAPAVSFNGIAGVAVGPDGDVFVSEINRHRIRRIAVQ